MQKKKFIIGATITGIILGISLGFFISARLNLEKNALSQQNKVLSEIQEASVNVAQDVGKTVVSISTVTTRKYPVRRFYFGGPSGNSDEFFKRFFDEFFGASPYREYKRVGLGSGLIIDTAGYILTNEHVIEGADKIKVTLSDGREFDAKVAGKDFRSDLAIIKINAHNLSQARLGNSDNLSIGEFVLAIGNPFGFAIENPEPTVTFGVVSALNRSLPQLGRRTRAYYELIQTDAAINPGNSGGPLVNLKGEVVGINVAIITTTGAYEGIGFATPINKAKAIMKRLIKGEEILYGWLGVSIQNITPDLKTYFGLKESGGSLVSKVYKNSPAFGAGVKEKDVILRFDGKAIKSTRDLVRFVNNTEPGKNVKVVVWRNRKELTLNIKIGQRPKNLESLVEETKGLWRGIEVRDITPKVADSLGIEENTGVYVAFVESASPADEAGIMRGDIIEKVEQENIYSSKDFYKAVGDKKGNVLIKTNRGYFVVGD